MDSDGREDHGSSRRRTETPRSSSPDGASTAKKASLQVGKSKGKRVSWASQGGSQEVLAPLRSSAVTIDEDEGESSLSTQGSEKPGHGAPSSDGSEKALTIEEPLPQQPPSQDEGEEMPHSPSPSHDPETPESPKFPPWADSFDRALLTTVGRPLSTGALPTMSDLRSPTQAEMADIRAELSASDLEASKRWVLFGGPPRTAGSRLHPSGLPSSSAPTLGDRKHPPQLLHSWLRYSRRLLSLPSSSTILPGDLRRSRSEPSLMRRKSSEDEGDSPFRESPKWRGADPHLVPLHSISLQMELLLPLPAYPSILKVPRQRTSRRVSAEPAKETYRLRCEFCGKVIELMPTFGEIRSLDASLTYCCQEFKEYVQEVSEETTVLFERFEEEEAARATVRPPSHSTRSRRTTPTFFSTGLFMGEAQPEGAEKKGLDPQAGGEQLGEAGGEQLGQAGDQLGEAGGHQEGIESGEDTSPDADEDEEDMLRMIGRKARRSRKEGSSTTSPRRLSPSEKPGLMKRRSSGIKDPERYGKGMISLRRWKVFSSNISSSSTVFSAKAAENVDQEPSADLEPDLDQVQKPSTDLEPDLDQVQKPSTDLKPDLDQVPGTTDTLNQHMDDAAFKEMSRKVKEYARRRSQGRKSISGQAGHGRRRSRKISTEPDVESMAGVSDKEMELLSSICRNCWLDLLKRDPGFSRDVYPSDCMMCRMKLLLGDAFILMQGEEPVETLQEHWFHLLKALLTTGKSSHPNWQFLDALNIPEQRKKETILSFSLRKGRVSIRTGLSSPKKTEEEMTSSGTNSDETPDAVAGSFQVKPFHTKPQPRSPVKGKQQLLPPPSSPTKSPRLSLTPCPSPVASEGRERQRRTTPTKSPVRSPNRRSSKSFEVISVRLSDGIPESMQPQHPSISKSDPEVAPPAKPKRQSRIGSDKVSRTPSPRHSKAERGSAGPRKPEPKRSPDLPENPVTDVPLKQKSKVEAVHNRRRRSSNKYQPGQLFFSLASPEYRPKDPDDYDKLPAMPSSTKIQGSGQRRSSTPPPKVAIRRTSLRHKVTEHKTKEHKVTEHKTKEHKVTEHKAKEYKVTEHEAKEHKVTEHKAKEHKVTEHKAKEYKVTEHKAKEHKVTEHKAKEHKVTEHKAKEYKVTEHKAKEYKVTEHEAKEYKVTEHEAKEYKVTGHKAKEYKVTEHEAKEYKVTEHEAKEHKVTEHKAEEYKVTEHKAKEHKVTEHKTKEHKVTEHKAKEHKVTERKAKEHKVKEKKVSDPMPTAENTVTFSLEVSRGRGRSKEWGRKGLWSKVRTFKSELGERVEHDVEAAKPRQRPNIPRIAISHEGQHTKVEQRGRIGHQHCVPDRNDATATADEGSEPVHPLEKELPPWKLSSHTSFDQPLLLPVDLKGTGRAKVVCPTCRDFLPPTVKQPMVCIGAVKENNRGKLHRACAVCNSKLDPRTFYMRIDDVKRASELAPIEKKRPRPRRKTTPSKKEAGTLHRVGVPRDYSQRTLAANTMATIGFKLSLPTWREDGWFEPPPLKPFMEYVDEGIGRLPSLTDWNGNPEIMNKYYEDGRKFMTIHMDGSGNVFYPSGNLAILIASVDGRVGHFTYIVFEDRRVRARIMAGFLAQGLGWCDYHTGNTRLTYNIHGGLHLDREGAKKQHWRWCEHVPRTKSNVFQPLCFGLNRYIGVRAMALDYMTLVFQFKQNFCKFQVGAEFQVQEGSDIPHGCSTYNPYLFYLSTMRTRIRSLLSAISTLSHLNRAERFHQPCSPPRASHARKQVLRWSLLEQKRRKSSATPSKSDNEGAVIPPPTATPSEIKKLPERNLARKSTHIQIH